MLDLHVYPSAITCLCAEVYVDPRTLICAGVHAYLGIMCAFVHNPSCLLYKVYTSYTIPYRCIPHTPVYVHSSYIFVCTCAQIPVIPYIWLYVNGVI